MNEEQISTIGIDQNFLGFRLSDGSVVNIRILDTGGQERFNSINEYYYRIADCCLLVYDITNIDSFNKIKNYYIEKIKEKSKSILKIVLLGNKTDLEKERKITQKMGTELAQENGYIFMESSCKDNYNVVDAFETLIEMTNNELLKSEKTPGFKIKEKRGKTKKKSKKIC